MHVLRGISDLSRAARASAPVGIVPPLSRFGRVDDLVRYRVRGPGLPGPRPQSFLKLRG